MSIRNRRAYKPTGVFQGLYGNDKDNRNDIGILREYDRSTKWINIGDTGAPAFGSSWLNYDAANYCQARFMRDAAGIVHIQGLIKNATNASGGTTFTMPAGFRIGFRNIFGLLGYNSGYVHVEAAVLTNGVVGLSYDGGSGITWVTLVNIHYPAEN